MYVWQMLRLKKPKKCYPHAAVKVGDFVYESVSPRVRKIPYSKFLEKYNKPEILMYQYPLSEAEYYKSLDYLESVKGRGYEYSNFIFHLINGFLFIPTWLGGRRDKKLYCYELVIRFMNISETIKTNPYLNPIEFEEEMVAFRKYLL